MKISKEEALEIFRGTTVIHNVDTYLVLACSAIVKELYDQLPGGVQYRIVFGTKYPDGYPRGDMRYWEYFVDVSDQDEEYPETREDGMVHCIEVFPVTYTAYVRKNASDNDSI